MSDCKATNGTSVVAGINWRRGRSQKNGISALGGARDPWEEPSGNGSQSMPSFLAIHASTSVNCLSGLWHFITYQRGPLERSVTRPTVFPSETG